jgi:pyruvate dehydrogenase E1 component alpha subunit
MAQTVQKENKQATNLNGNSKPAAGKAAFPKETYMHWYEEMLLMRRFEEKAGQLYGQQKIRGFCHLYIGQEAVVAGTMSALQKGDKIITAYRDHAHAIAAGITPNAVMAELFGKIDGCSKGKGGSMHMFSKEHGFYGGHGIVGAQIPMGAGIAFAEKYNETNNICVTFMGDGAVRQGALHETFTMAMLWKLPVVFICENNKYGMGTAVERTTNVPDLYKIALAYDMPSAQVDGMECEAVHNAVKEAADRARNEHTPTFLEIKTYRYKGHSMSDPAKYRTREELDEYKTKDPIEQVEKIINAAAFATKEEMEAIDEKVKHIVEESVNFAEQSPYPDPSELYNDNYLQKDYPFLMD